MTTPPINALHISATAARQRAFVAQLAAQAEAEKGMSFRVAVTEKIFPALQKFICFACKRGLTVNVSPNRSEIIKAVLAARIAALAGKIPA